MSAVILALLCAGFPLVFGTCDSPIFCEGEILNAILNAKVFDDSIHFFNYRLKYGEDTVVEEFNKIPKNERGTKRMKDFIGENFIKCDEPSFECSDLEWWTPSDWSKSSKLSSKIMNTNYSSWVTLLNYGWLDLGHKVGLNVQHHPEKTSLLYVPNGYIKAGKKMQELFYWDSYWIIKGLLASDMKDSSKGIIENHIELLKKEMDIPKSNRIYSSERTQQPMLASMFEAYHEATKDDQFIKDNIQILTKGVDSYAESRKVLVKKYNNEYTLYRFYSPSRSPRLDRYFQDLKLAENMNETEKMRLFTNLRSAEESGWTSSSRWYIDEEGTNEGTLKDTKVEHIIPVDLNALMHKNYKLLSQWYKEIIKDDKLAEKYEEKANELLKAIDNILWNPSQGIWLDYDNLNKKPRNYFYISNFFPLWTKSYKFDDAILAQNVLSYIDRNGLMRFYGIPASLKYSGEIWDFPNSWASLQTILVDGLRQLGGQDAKSTALKMAERWVQSSFLGYVQNGYLCEHYHINKKGLCGIGQDDHENGRVGWTLGSILDLLNLYPHLTPPFLEPKYKKKFDEIFSSFEPTEKPTFEHLTVAY